MEAELQAGMSKSGTMAFLGIQQSKIGEDKDNYLLGQRIEQDITRMILH